MITKHINDLITATKAMPNSLERNKIISKLEDAKAWSITMQNKLPQSVLDKEPPMDNKVYGNLPSAAIGTHCTCPEGARDTNCMATHAA